MSARRRGLPALPERAADSHKGTYGRILVVAGSRPMPGAAVLAAHGALRGGAGLVTVATPESAQPIVAAGTPCATFLPLPETRRGFLAAAAFDELLERAQASDVVAIGPGLGTAHGTVALVRRFVAAHRGPLVIDADALNALADEPQPLRVRADATVLTPHPGELARLDGEPPPIGDAARRARATAAATRFRAVVLLKGHRTVIAAGGRVAVNTTGNPGMATGGAGDVLTGLLAALLARFDDPFDAAVLAAHVHGRAGDLAARHVGETALIATDLLDHLAEAFRRDPGGR